MEKTVELYLCKKAKMAGGIPLKLTGYKGIPDRMLLLKNGKAVFVEAKDEGRIPRTEQKIWLEKLKDLGFDAVFVDSKEAVDALMEGYGKGDDCYED